MASISEATYKQYGKPIRLWWTFAQQISSDWFAPDISRVLDFLATLSESIATYGTLNSYRFAISLVTNVNLGSDERIKRFCKGVSVLKPSKPKYVLTWDPAPVLTYLSSLWPHESLNTKILTGKLVTLLALASAQRVQTLSLIKRKNIVLGDPTIVKIPDRTKTSGIGRFQPSMTFRKFTDQPALCVVSLLLFYMERTKNNSEVSGDALFLTLGKKVRAASSQTISRWIKETLKKAGIDTTIFTAHSTRHASTSSAARFGVSMDEIRRAAGWSPNSATFAKFYDRRIILIR